MLGEEPALVRKRFHSKGWRRWGDRRRAVREFENLQLAYAAGLAVPMPREVSRLDEGWCLTMDRVPGARSLLAVLETEPDLLPETLSEQLGRLLASLVHVGLEHGDLHLGNLVLDDAGKVWLLDFGQARPRDERALLAKHADLITLLASLRELANIELRESVVRSYLEAVGPKGASYEQNLDELDRAARLERRRSVLRNLNRWTRESGVARLTSVPGRVELTARREPDSLSARLVVEGEESTRAWLTSARLFEHHIPTLAPIRLLTQPTRAAEFELPAGLLPLSEARAQHSEELLTTNFTALLERLHDRGIELRSLAKAEPYVAPSGELHLHPLVLLDELDARVGPRSIQPHEFLAIETPEVLT